MRFLAPKRYNALEAFVPPRAQQRTDMTAWSEAVLVGGWYVYANVCVHVCACTVWLAEAKMGNLGLWWARTRLCACVCSGRACVELV